VVGDVAWLPRSGSEDFEAPVRNRAAGPHREAVHEGEGVSTTAGYVFSNTYGWETHSMRMHADEIEIDEPLVHQLISTQMPAFDGCLS
jgi:hypothetical protein